MKIVLEGRVFDLDKIDLSKKENFNNWHTQEGLFLRKLHHFPELIREMITYCEENIELLEILQPSNGPPGEATKYFALELKHCMKMGPNLFVDYFVEKLLSKYPKAFMASVNHVLGKNHVYRSD